MKSRPCAPDLLAIARDTFAAEILPKLPESARYTALMIANALAIARREIEVGEAPLRAELDRLRELYPDVPRDVPASALRETVARYSRRLAHDIRAGRYDACPAPLRGHLRATTIEKLRVSNPRLLNDT